MVNGVSFSTGAYLAEIEVPEVSNQTEGMIPVMLKATLIQALYVIQAGMIHCPFKGIGEVQSIDTRFFEGGEVRSTFSDESVQITHEGEGYRMRCALNQTFYQPTVARRGLEHY